VINCKLCYNYTMTFQKGNTIWKGRKHTEETKKKMSLAQTGRVVSKETREKMRQAKLKNPTNYWLGKKRPEIKKWLTPFKKGHKTWNKGKPWSKEVKEKIKRASKGRHYSRETEFKKGIIPWCKGKRWGESLRTIHRWIRIDYGEPDICEKCRTNKEVEWSNKDHKYKHDRKFWQKLCRKCHMEYDRKMGFRT